MLHLIRKSWVLIATIRKVKLQGNHEWRSAAVSAPYTLFEFFSVFITVAHSAKFSCLNSAHVEKAHVYSHTVEGELLVKLYFPILIPSVCLYVRFSRTYSFNDWTYFNAIFYKCCWWSKMFSKTKNFRGYQNFWRSRGQQLCHMLQLTLNRVHPITPGTVHRTVSQ